jgi:UDP:flavonoid glycosyltransferase YjiC (YdhE family)
MNVKNVLTVIILTVYVCYGNCARILGIFIVPSKSHHILGSKLLKSLAEKGHEVTMISPFPFKNKVTNYQDIFLEEMLQYKQEKLQGLLTHNATLTNKMTLVHSMFYNMSEIFLSHKKVQNLKTEKFDLIIQFALFSESYLGLAHHFGAPVILLHTLGSTPVLNKIIGNTAPPSYVPSLNSFSQTSTEMTFFQRVRNTLHIWYNYVINFPKMENLQQELLSKHFPEAPSLQELLTNVSLVFVNSHYSIESPRPYVPNMIQIGGFHVEEPKQLPQHLKEFLDSATEGAVLFSLGSNVKISSLPREKLQAIIKVLGRLKMKVLFKTEHELDGLPSNIKTQEWLPQNDILAHPNIKLFISHGGLLSTIEAVYHGIPILGIPIFGDQQMNIADAAINGYALKIDIGQLNEEQFSNVISEILTNPKYRDNIQLRSSLMRDQPIKPLDKAIFWVEHVLKYKGAAHLKNSSNKLYLYQYLLLDVIVFIFTIIFLIVMLLYILVKGLVRFVKHILRKIKYKRD